MPETHTNPKLPPPQWPVRVVAPVHVWVSTSGFGEQCDPGLLLMWRFVTDRPGPRWQAYVIRVGYLPASGYQDVRQGWVEAYHVRPVEVSRGRPTAI